MRAEASCQRFPPRWSKIYAVEAVAVVGVLDSLPPPAMDGHIMQCRYCNSHRVYRSRSGNQRRASFSLFVALRCHSCMRVLTVPFWKAFGIGYNDVNKHHEQRKAA
jgi:hypothetical protein